MKKISYLASSILFLLAHSLSAETYTAEVWADNWFSLSLNGEQIAEDVDLNSIFVQADSSPQRFRLTNQQTQYGFIAVPV